MEKTKSEPILLAPPEGTYTYVAVKASLYASECAIFGVTEDEKIALSERFVVDSGSTAMLNGIHLRGQVMSVINSLGELGYRVIASSGENEITWTLQREV